MARTAAGCMSVPLKSSKIILHILQPLPARQPGAEPLLSLLQLQSSLISNPEGML